VTHKRFVLHDDNHLACGHDSRGKEEGKDETLASVLRIGVFDVYKYSGSQHHEGMHRHKSDVDDGCRLCKMHGLLLVILNLFPSPIGQKS
jgi:hypothetical protein